MNHFRFSRIAVFTIFLTFSVGFIHSNAAGNGKMPHGHQGQAHEGICRGFLVLSNGYAVMSGTLIDGRPVLRLCTINPRTTTEEIDAVIGRLEGFVQAGGKTA